MPVKRKFATHSLDAISNRSLQHCANQRIAGTFSVYNIDFTILQVQGQLLALIMKFRVFLVHKSTRTCSGQRCDLLTREEITYGPFAYGHEQRILFFLLARRLLGSLPSH